VTLDGDDFRRHVGNVSVGTLLRVEAALKLALDLPQ
jgi:hypothetical protein